MIKKLFLFIAINICFLSNIYADFDDYFGRGFTYTSIIQRSVTPSLTQTFTGKLIYIKDITYRSSSSGLGTGSFMFTVSTTDENGNTYPVAFPNREWGFLYGGKQFLNRYSSGSYIVSVNAQTTFTGTVNISINGTILDKKPQEMGLKYYFFKNLTMGDAFKNVQDYGLAILSFLFIIFCTIFPMYLAWKHATKKRINKNLKPNYMEKGKDFF